MINMMYLVLIALLAMNVSKEILKAFHLMEVSFDNTGASLNSKMKASISSIQAEVKKQGPRAKPFANRANEAQKLVDDLVKYLNDQSKAVEKMAGGRSRKDASGNDDHTSELAKPDDTEKHANYFASKKEDGQGNGIILRKKIEETRKALIKLLESDANATDSTGMKIPAAYLKEMEASSDLLTTNYKDADKKEIEWEVMLLVETPLAGAVTNIARLKNEALNLGNNVVSKLQQSINADDLKFDNMVAMVNAPTSYVMSGSKYEADILLVASSSSVNYEINLNGGGTVPVTGGIGKYTAGASGAGSHTLAGEIVLPGKKPFPFKAEWTSFLPAATISATKMNVLYIGLPNPIEVSVPGVAPGNVTASMSGGSLSNKGGGKYVATVSGGKEATIRASAKMPDGSTRSMGAVPFRIKRVPPPTASFGSITGGSASVGKVKGQNKLFVYLQNFPYEGITYTVNSCEVSVSYKNKPPLTKRTNGGAIGRLPVEPGCKVFIGSIRVTGPGRSNELIPGGIIVSVTR